MTDKHTPGPWQFDELGIIYSGDCAELCAHHSNDHVVAILSGARPEDARLIAAAPLMLEALEMLVSAVLDHESNESENDDDLAAARNIALDALRTARGELAAIAAATGEDA